MVTVSGHSKNCVIGVQNRRLKRRLEVINEVVFADDLAVLMALPQNAFSCKYFTRLTPKKPNMWHCKKIIGGVLRLVD